MNQNFHISPLRPQKSTVGGTFSEKKYFSEKNNVFLISYKSYNPTKSKSLFLARGKALCSSILYFFINYIYTPTRLFFVGFLLYPVGLVFQLLSFCRVTFCQKWANCLSYCIVVCRIESMENTYIIFFKKYFFSAKGGVL